jgi:release factor glutamine methyltransferase
MRTEELIAEAGSALRSRAIRNGQQEARWLLLHAMRGWPGQVVCCCCGADLPADLEQSFRALLRRRLAGEPLQYVLGSAEFYGLELEVGPGVLIPRPETERLVDFALAACPESGPVCDLCTGSGAIALAIAHARPRLGPVWATDVSPEALDYARRNAAKLALAVTFVHGDLWCGIPSDLRFALVTANPPYVSPAAYAELPAEVKDYEPRLALWADQNGLALLRRIAHESRDRLLPGAALVCEISSEQGAAARAAFTAAGYHAIDVRQDYTGRDRVVIARCPLSPRGDGGA